MLPTPRAQTSSRASVRNAVAGGRGLRLRPRPRLLVALALGALTVSCGQDLKRECKKTRIGEPIASARVRLDQTGAKHRVTAPGKQELWQKQFGMGGLSCYLDYDASGRVTRIDYHEGN